MERILEIELAMATAKTPAALMLERATRTLETLPTAFRTVGTTVQPVREVRGARKRRQLEHEMQAAFIAWTLEPLMLKLHPELFNVYAVPNGTNSSVIAAARAKREGLKPGIPDLHLPHARGTYIGWWCESKIGSNDLTENQRVRCACLHEAGHAVTVHWSLESMQVSVLAYLERGERVGLPAFLEDR